METKEVELAKREEELSTKIRLLENQKNILIKESKSLENEAKKRKAGRQSHPSHPRQGLTLRRDKTATT